MSRGPWRIIFLGTPQFALPSLKGLLEAGEDVAAVVTQPDRPRGRGQKVTPSPVKELALAWNLPVLQPHRLKDPELLARLRAYEPELMIVVAYGRILTHDLLAMPSVGFLNVHASLLPRYRGPAPLNWALINGDAETGVTIQWVNYEVDTGPIFLQERLPISDADNVGTLYTTLSERGAALLVQALELLRQGRGIRQEQPDTGVTLAPMITKEMRRINWGLPAHEVCGWIRGQDPRPGAYGLWGGKVVRLFGGRIMQSEGQAGPPGAAVRLTSYGLEIACGQGSVAVAELQLAGHKRLPAAEFLRGQPLLHQLLQ